MADTDTTTNSNQRAERPTPDPALPRLRTFADDLSEEIKKKGATTASIVQAERERAAREIALTDDTPAPRSAWRSPLILGLTIGLLVLGFAAVGGAYLYSTLTSSRAPEAAQSIIFPNKVVALTQPTYQTLADTLALERLSVNLPLGEIERIDATLATASTSPQAILTALGAPEPLVREARSVMVGIHSFDRNQPFLIIEVAQYDRAYGAMLKWEPDMGRALGNLYKPVGGKVAPTTTFTDKVYQNIDIRVSQPEWPILYAFPRRDLLIITTNQYTLSEILTRLAAGQRTPTTP